MSARESIENLWDRATPVAPLLDAYAHELAEKQRAAIEKTDDPVFYRGEAGWLPDLIDPEVSNSGS